MTDKEIEDVIASGKGFSQTTRTIDPSKKYEAPALEEKPIIEYVDFDTVYNEIFGNGYTLASPTTVFENLVSNILSSFTNTNLVMYACDANGLKLYAEGINKGGRNVFTQATYKGSDLEKINSYLSDYAKY
ncbi:MAG TPA: hypothetical protein DEQ88_00225 [Clostridiales bacterium]|nr:hypothetical protein [Clostridiales bacterium]